MRSRDVNHTAGRRRSSEAGEQEGTSWCALETRPGHFDFTPLAKLCDRCEKANRNVVLDLLNFDWPNHLDITRREFIDAFTDFVEATTAFVAARGGMNIAVIPVQQISLLATAAGDLAMLPPYLRAMGGLVQRQLVKAALRASEIVRAKLPGATLLSVEPMISLHSTERAQARVIETWDMLTGRVCPELGGSRDYLNMLGVRLFEGDPLFEQYRAKHQDAAYTPFHKTLVAIHARFGLPLLVTRGGMEQNHDPGWLHFVERELRAARDLHVPIVGMNFHPEDRGLRTLAAALDRQHAFSVSKAIPIQVSQAHG